MEISGFRGEIRRNEPLARHTSFGIGGPADMLVYPEDREDLLLLFESIRRDAVPYMILGGGTNLLVRDKGFRGVAISLRKLDKVKIEREFRSLGGIYAVISAEAGAALAKLLSFASQSSLTGIEFAAGIPGTVGGAVCMNAGTAEGEMGDIVEKVEFMDPDGQVVAVSREEMRFEYRKSGFAAGWIVIGATVKLRHDDTRKISEKIRDLMEKRKEYQPWGLPNAGSIFKNPLDEAAGKLIDLAGLKGKSSGGARVSEKHANFIVNTGNASAADVLSLMSMVKKTVLEVHGVRLEPEIKIVGEE
jgi:UDP-N-acetylmuramate dehydrogenase